MTTSYNIIEFLEKRESNKKEEALKDARRIADYLQKKYNSQVWGIGSLFSKTNIFTDKSDIDLVVSNIPNNKYFSVLATLDSFTNFPLDIIPYENANSLILKNIKKNIECVCFSKNKIVT